ncbi:polysaccharide lyase family 3 protein [Dothidotthia symphoricarpi CBS 119687]|uniref:Pectate lyase n=1 Tax=Dothidotthia symphoricarpi CBS 119687 TaxID=1392245 RepID=A0A6A5ZYE3_9PLEO|nr:polysaccharide lyase family 3 protein [Dothidotthia symphoricarpi CBS 119687]KAF2124620.1 polysaccharide lyase family 3 protein [Dothidotthia symphoricarpi CBS 119687]
MQYLAVALCFGLSAAQTLNIPTRVGNVVPLSSASVIPRGVTRNLGNQEFDRGMKCAEGDTGSKNAVFVLEDGATLENVIIGANALEGVHCLASCTVRNVWFRDVCEDAVSALGTFEGSVLIEGGGAQNAEDKVVQHNGSGRVTIRNYTVVNAGKLYRACGDCTNNSSRGARHVTIENLRANNVRTNLAGINKNYGDTATISGSCGTVSGEICQQFNGINKGEGSGSPEIAGKENCLGAQGKLARGALPRC